MPDDRYYMRNPAVSAVARRDGYLFVRPGREPLIVDPTAVQEVTSLLCALVSPMSGDQLDSLVEDDLREFLVAEGIVLTGSQDELLARLPPPPTPPDQRPCSRLVFGLTGAIGAYQLVTYLRELHLVFCRELDVILTEAAQKLVRPELFKYLGLRVWTDAFESRGAVNVPHMELAARADLVVVMPASASTLFKLAHGACTDLLSLTVAATSAPVVVVPAMNPSMWSNPAIARNVAQLREDGVYVVVPGAGHEVARIGDADPESPAQADAQRESPAGGGVGIPLRGLASALATILRAHKEWSDD